MRVPTSNTADRKFNDTVGDSSCFEKERGEVIHEVEEVCVCWLS